MRRSALRPAVAVLVLLVLLGCLGFTRTEEREDCAERDPLRRPFFGDTHVHTTLSFDGWGQGTMARPDDAYRYAAGETIESQAGPIRLRRPLDFAVVTDHSDLLGETRICKTPGLPGHDSLVCRVVRRWPGLGYALVNGHVYSAENPARYSFCRDGDDPAGHCVAAARDLWQEIQDAAERHYDRSAACRLTTFVGYEWTGMPGGRNIHRNVVFRNAVTQDYPTTYIETPTAEGLWAALTSECLEGKQGCDVIAIPHNSNASAGRMWAVPDTLEDVRARMRLERLVEVTQHKGDSECRPSDADPQCAYEKMPIATLADMATPIPYEDIPPRSFAREILTEGLAHQERLGENPYAFGLIGATDTHFATPGMVDEDEFIGHAAGLVNARFGVPPFPDAAMMNPGGLAVLWAEENSRDALFEAMKRREAYGTSGPRMLVRFFGGWEYAEDLCGSGGGGDALVERGYEQGVPMGGVLKARPEGAAAPVFAVSALRDPGTGGSPSTPLQRIQIVKGNVDGSEQVFDVAGRADTGADVDLATCEPRGKGFDQLCSVWRDPDFDPKRPAYYYVRVLENPSCRWSQYACNRIGGAAPECSDESIPPTIQERAWTSPIWYTP